MTPGGDTQRPPPAPVIPAMSSAALLLASLLTLATATPPAPPHAAAAGERGHVQVRRVCTVSARSIRCDDCRPVSSLHSVVTHTFNDRKETPTPSWPSCHSPWRCSTPSSTSSLPSTTTTITTTTITTTTTTTTTT